MYYHARYYDPLLRRFTQPDTIIPNPHNPQDLNRYTYTRNNPIKYTDPSGHKVTGSDSSGCTMLDSCDVSDAVRQPNGGWLITNRHIDTSGGNFGEVTFTYTDRIVSLERTDPTWVDAIFVVAVIFAPELVAAAASGGGAAWTAGRQALLRNCPQLCPTLAGGAQRTAHYTRAAVHGLKDRLHGEAAPGPSMPSEGIIQNVANGHAAAKHAAEFPLDTNLADVVRRTIKVATSSGTREDGADWWFDAVEKVVVYINPVPNKHGDYGSVFVVMRDNYPLPDGTIVNPTP